jgi:hypothetical protein
MSALKSQNGWPASENRAEIGIKVYEIAGANQHFALAEKIAPIMCAFLEEFNRLIEPINKAGSVFDDGGYNYRPVRGATALSNHSSATAVDINTSIHIWKKIGTFKPLKVIALRALCKKYGIRWGGDYKDKSRIDEMHFEIVETPSQVQARIKTMNLKMPKEKK